MYHFLTEITFLLQSDALWDMDWCIVGIAPQVYFQMHVYSITSKKNDIEIDERHG